MPVNSDSDASARVPYDNKSSTGVLLDRKNQGKNIPNHHGDQHYCVMCKNSGMPEHKKNFHSSKNCFGKRSDQASIKDGL